MSYLKRPYDWHDAQASIARNDSPAYPIVAKVTRPVFRNVDIGTPQARAEKVGDDVLWNGAFSTVEAARDGVAKRFPQAPIVVN